METTCSFSPSSNKHWRKEAKSNPRHRAERRQRSDVLCKSFEIRFPRLIILADAAFETHAQELLRLHGKFHRQLPKHLFAEAIDDQSDGVLG